MIPQTPLMKKIGHVALDAFQKDMMGLSEHLKAGLSPEKYAKIETFIADETVIMLLSSMHIAGIVAGMEFATDKQLLADLESKGL